MAAEPKPRLFRLQFSLRWLLLLTAAVGIGLGVYRRPWVTEQFVKGDPYERPVVITTTWRRNWHGKWEKHGSETRVELEMHRGTELRYVNGEIRQRRFFKDGVLTEKQDFHNGFAFNIQFQPAQEEVSGVWISTQQFGTETVTQRCPWRNGERHGLSTWTSSNGRLLQSAEFERGRIVKWNGEDVAEALERRIDREVGEPFQTALRATVRTDNDFSRWGHIRSRFIWFNDNRLLAHYGFRDVNFAGPARWRPCYSGRIQGEVLLEMALGESGLLTHRYGVPCVVPICTRGLEWRDPTNVAAVKFPDRTPEAYDWIKPARADFAFTGWPAAQLQRLCADTTLHIDTTAIDRLDPPPRMTPIPKTVSDYPRPLRDVFGHILYDSGYRCEQRADVIVVLPIPKT